MHTNSKLALINNTHTHINKSARTNIERNQLNNETNFIIGRRKIKIKRYRKGKMFDKMMSSRESHAFVYGSESKLSTWVRVRVCAWTC